MTRWMPASAIPGRFGPVLALALAACASPGEAQPASPPLAAQAPTYADLVNLAEQASIIAIVEISEEIEVEAERSPGLAPGRVRLYLETLTQALLTAPAPLGESLSFLADVPRDSEGDPPELEQTRMMVFAEPVEGRPEALRLVRTDAMMPALPALERQVRSILEQFSGPDSVPRITGVRDVISIEGNLAGESETQMFLETEDRAPASLSVIRRPGMTPQWGVSWTEIVDQSIRPPMEGTIEWYRLACFLPRSLPDSAYLQQDQPARSRAREDYAYILEDLGPCRRNLD